MAKELRDLGERLIGEGFEVQGNHLIVHADEWEKQGHLPKSLQESKPQETKKDIRDTEDQKGSTRTKAPETQMKVQGECLQ